MTSSLLRLRRICAARGIHALSQLALLEQIRPGLIAQDLAAELGMQRSSLDAALKALEQTGLIDRKRVTDRDHGDLRSVNISRTVQGETLLAEIRGIMPPR